MRGHVDPINAVKIFNEKEADELIVLDIDATAQGAQPNFRLIAQFAAECRMPLCYGGAGSLADIGRLIAACGIVGAAAGSLFVFKGSYRAVLINYPGQGEKEDLISSALNHG